MTRKDFELIAQVLRDTRPMDWAAAAPVDIAKLEQWRLTVDHMAACLAVSNPRFDINKFKKACNNVYPA